jgi:AcrR family transcriptional regulator
LTSAREGLRERKKRRTRAALREHALRLFREQGYAATTIEEIAEAAEVSPSTFFRYFPTKEDVVLADDLDPPMLAAFHAQPRELTPVQALRGAMRSVLGSIPAEELERERARQALIMTTPELRARTLDQLTGTLQMAADMLAERAGREPDDPAVRTVAGALIGIAIAAMVTAMERPDADVFGLIDDGLARLEAGLKL